jgi:uncharacterized membrane protein
MPFCATCGAQVEGRFCAKCGSPVATAAQGAAAPPPPPGAGAPGYPPPSGYAQQPYGQPGMMAPPPVAAPMADNVASALCYVLGFITGIIFLVMAPYNQNRTVRFHAFQSIFMSVGLIAVRIVLGMIFGTLLFSGGFGTMVLWSMLWTVFGLACFVLWIYMLIQTYQGKTIVLPIIGPLAQKQA